MGCLRRERLFRHIKPESHPFLPFCGSKIGIPFLIGYFWLHFTQTRLFLSFV